MINFDKTGRRVAYDRLQAAARLTRTWGDGYGYLMVATGRADVMVDPIMALWDAAALPPVLEEAGGTFTDWHGNRTIHGGEGIATNGLLLEEVLALHTTRKRILRNRLGSGYNCRQWSDCVPDLQGSKLESRNPYGNNNAYSLCFTHRRGGRYGVAGPLGERPVEHGQVGQEGRRAA